MKKNLLFFAAIMLIFIADGYSQVTQNTGAMQVYVSGYGKFRLNTNDGTRQLDRASILVGTSESAVLDFNNDINSVLEPSALVTTPLLSDFEIAGIYGRDASSSLPDVTEKVNVYGWTDANYVIVKFTVTNVAASEITARIGLDILPDLNEEYIDSISYNSVQDVIRYHWGAGYQNIGVKQLSTAMTSLYSFEWYDGYEVDADYWSWMTKDSFQDLFFSGTGEGTVTITSQAPVVLAPGESTTVYYAFAMADDQATMLAGIAAAKQKYESSFTSLQNRQSSVKGLKNYPNPVKSSTKISFDLPKAGFVSLKIYDVLGHEVATLLNSTQSAGLHTLDFSAENLKTGVYSYRLSCNNQVSTSKMLIVK